MRFFSFLVAALPLAAAAPVVEKRQAVPLSRYIVVLKPEATDSLLQEAIDLLLGQPVDFVYNLGMFKGFAASLTEVLLTTITSFSAVAYVEPDTTVHASALTSQPAAPYGLARISHRERGSANYVYDASAGEGTCSYIIDTGIYTAHNDFEGRATHLADFSGENSPVDGNGHGTHVAGTVGGKTYGVAKKTKLYAVKVLGADGSGSNAGVLAGIDFAVRDSKSRAGCAGKSVANLSLGGTRSKSSNDAVAAAVKAGVFMAVAAGNSMMPTALFSPASEPTVCTVGATDEQDRLASFSNTGMVIDILAPGVNIKSTWIRGPDDTNTISGTSMATPHVAGLAAYLLRLEGSKDPQALCQRIKDLSTKNKVSGTTLTMTGNRLAFNGAEA